MKGGLHHYLERKQDRLLHLGAHWCTLLDGTELGDDLSHWGSAEQLFPHVTATSNPFLAKEEAIDSSEESDVIEEDSDILWEMEALQLQDEHRGNYSTGSVDSDDDESNLAPPAKRKRTL